MTKFIKEWFELKIKLRWLKQVNRAVDKYNRLNEKARIQGFIAKEMMRHYNEIYADNVEDDGDNPEGC